MKRFVLFAALMLAGCDKSAPFALPDGCYFADDGQPILEVRGEQGQILTPLPRPNSVGYGYQPIRRVHLRARVDGAATYVEVTPSFYLTERLEAATSSEQPTRFAIRTDATGLAILVNMEAAGETPVRRRPCRAGGDRS